MMISVSFIIPIYNVESYIQRCIESVFALGLSEQEMEIICVDDCSPDKSAEIVKQLSCKHSCIRLLQHHENKRQGGARNTGINNARGKYCIFLDADDTLPDYNVKDVLNHMDEANLDMFLGKADVVRPDKTTVWGNPIAKETPIMKGTDFFTDYLVHSLAYGVVWLGIYRTGFALSIPPFRENVQMEDTDWCYQVLYEVQRVQYQPVTIYQYRVNPSSTTHQRNILQILETFQQVCIINQIGENNRERSEWGYKCTSEYTWWRLRCLKGLWQFSNADRRLFYQSISSGQIDQLCKVPLEFLPRVILKYPKLSQVCFFMIAPLFKTARWMRNKYKQLKNRT